jgi:hypothetical protein
MLFAPALLQRSSFTYGAGIAGILLAAAVIALGFRSTGSAMFAEAAFQQGRALPPISDLVSSPQKVQFTANNLSHTKDH